MSRNIHIRLYMSSKATKRSPENHESIAVVALALLAFLTFAGADAFSAPDSPVIAHANTSANPYQPVQWQNGVTPSYNGGIHSYDGTSVSREPISPEQRHLFERRLKALKRSASLIAKQIVRAEDAMDTLERKNGSPDLLQALQSRIASLDKRLAAINAKIMSLEIRINPSLDQSQ